MNQHVALSSALAFGQTVATRLRANVPQGWVVHDIFAGEEHIEVLAVLPHGVFALEGKAYRRQLILPREVEVVRQTRYGTRYEIHAAVETPSGRRLTLRSIWQMDDGTDVPRLLTLVPD